MFSIVHLISKIVILLKMALTLEKPLTVILSSRTKLFSVVGLISV
jgi:hypothetical protein